MLYERFTEETGIKLNLIEGKSEELLARLTQEGEFSPGDVLLTVDAGRLWRAEEAGLFAPIASTLVEERIPAHLRHPDGLWFGISKRARVVIYNKDAGAPQGLTNYADLADPSLAGQVCVRSSSNIYNISLLASIVAHDGAEAAEAWTEGVVANFARAPQGNDTAQIRAVAAGECRVGIANTYYVARLMRSEDEADLAVADKIGVIFPEQETRGTHVNISGAGLLAYAPNKDNAVRFLEFLTSDWAQKVLADGNNEYPAARAQARQARLTKPAGSLGQLEDIAIQLASLSNRERPSVSTPHILIFAGDHGITAEGVSAYPSEVTAQMLANFVTGGAAISVLAREQGAALQVVDVGTLAHNVPHGVHADKIAHGTENFRRGDAMSEDELFHALGAGRNAGARAIGEGADLLLLGEMGIGNTSAASAVAAALTDGNVAALAGAGTGLDADGISHKTRVIAESLAFHKLDAGNANAAQVLRKVGGHEIAALAGAAITAAQARVPVLVDGFICTAAMLAAVSANPCFPAVGLIVGSLLALVLWSGSLIDPWVGAVLTLGAWAFVTGALHLDGLSDLADALGAAHADETRFHEVLKDPHIGTFGVVSLIVQLAVKLVLLILIAEQELFWVLIPLCAWARLGPLFWAQYLPVLRPQSTEAQGMGERFSWEINPLTPWAWAALLLVSAWGAPAFLAAPFILLVWGAYLQIRLKGQTGDSLGAGIEVSESLLLLACVIFI
eukprot:g4721.t1